MKQAITISASLMARLPSAICVVVIGAFALSLTGCSEFTAAGHSDERMSEWRAEAEALRASGELTSQKRTFTRAKADVIAPSGPSELEIAAGTLPVERISLDMKDCEIKVVLEALARLTDQNILVSSGLTEKMTVELNDVPWNMAFINILDMNSLSYTVEEGIISILSAEDLKRELEFQALRKSVKDAKNQVEIVKKFYTRAIHVNHLDAAKLGATLSEVLGIGDESEESEVNAASHERAKVVINEELSTVIITAELEELNNMLGLIEQLDVPQMQVVVDAKIVIATKDVAKELGANWSLDSNSYTNSVDGGNYTINGGAFGKTGELLEEIGMGALGINMAKTDRYSLDVLISALESHSMIKVQSSPSITTLDNRTAYIESGTEIPYQTEADNTVTTEFKKAVLRLEVTPHVIDGEMVKIEIYATKDEVDDSIQNASNEPAIFTRSTRTHVMLQDGETTVIAGLTETKDSEGDSGVPYLKDIPYLGNLFQTQINSGEMSDLLIFVTPRIIKPRIITREVEVTDESQKSESKHKELSTSSITETEPNVAQLPE